jgi:hypothetical protein
VGLFDSKIGQFRSIYLRTLTTCYVRRALMRSIRLCGAFGSVAIHRRPRPWLRSMVLIGVFRRHWLESRSILMCVSHAVDDAGRKVDSWFGPVDDKRSAPVPTWQALSRKLYFNDLSSQLSHLCSISRIHSFLEADITIFVYV